MSEYLTNGNVYFVVLVKRDFLFDFLLNRNKILLQTSSLDMSHYIAINFYIPLSLSVLVINFMQAFFSQIVQLSFFLAPFIDFENTSRMLSEYLLRI